MFIAAAFVCAATTFAAVSADKAAWGKGPVRYLMTKEELSAWNALAADAEADAFVTAFWSRRDPTPGTATNEMRDEFEKRVAFADQSFASRGIRGSLADRGHTYIMFGSPARVTPTTVGEIKKTVWAYEGPLVTKIFGRTSAEIVFSDPLNTGDFRLESKQSVDVEAGQQKVVMGSIVPVAPPKVVVAPVVETPANTFKTASLEAAIADAKGGKIAPKDSVITYAEFMSPGGEYYIPLGLFVPPSAGLTADAADTFFGVVEDAEGKRVHVFEVPAKATSSKNSLLYDTTVMLPTGKYTATVGLAKAGVQVLAGSSALEVKTTEKDFVGTSKLVLADVMETIEAAPVKSPFAFGKLKIIPRSTFTNKDELGYFIEVHNPGIDPTTNLPKLQAKLDLIRPTGSPISAPLSDAQALPLSGAAGPGEYALISGIPLGELSKPLAPGDYSLRVKVVDTITKQSYTVEQKFKILG